MRKTVSALTAALVGGGVVVATATSASASANEPCGDFPVTTDEQYEAMFASSPYDDTRATGNYDLIPEGLRVWTEGATSTDKVTGYRDLTTPVPLAGNDADTDYAITYAGTPTGILPGYQLIIDFGTSETDAAPDGVADGILVGEEIYGDDWWLNNLAQPWVKDRAPQTGGGSGSEWYGTLAEWSAEFPDAEILSFGFSLGSGVQNDVVITELLFADCTNYVFSELPPPPPNQAPSAYFTINSAGDKNYRTFGFDARRSSDPDGDRLTYSWRFGDGTYGRGAQIKHAFPPKKGKTYWVTLTVRDTAGNTDTLTRKVIVH